MERLFYNKFTDKKDWTESINYFGKKIITIKNNEIYFAIYDSCSWEFYYRHQLLGYKSIKFNGYLLFFSLCNKFSFDSLDDCIRIYSEFGGKNV